MRVILKVFFFNYKEYKGRGYMHLYDDNPRNIPYNLREEVLGHEGVWGIITSDLEQSYKWERRYT